MNFNSLLLMIAAPLIVIAVFCLVFSFDNHQARKKRRYLLIIALACFLLIGIIVYRLFRAPLSLTF